MLIYKSDTQGFDEIIATSFDLSFWHNVKIGIFELWRLDGKEYDKDKFHNILDKFTFKVFAKHPAQLVSSTDIENYIAASDGKFDDLIFWNE